MKRGGSMRRLITFALVFSAAALADAQNKPAVYKALAPLQGTWVLTSPSGQPLGGEGGELTFAITGDTYAQAIGGAVNERGTIKVDGTKKPMWIDLAIKDGAD